MRLFKNKEDKPKRKGENAIGKIIYGFLLFAPLLSILFTSLYATFNSNAYQSYSGNTEVITEIQTNYKYESNEVNNVDDLIVGNIYTFDISSISSFNNGVIIFNSYSVYFTKFNECFNIEVTPTEAYMTRLFTEDNQFKIGFYNSNGSYIWLMTIDQTTVNFVYRNNFNSNFISSVSICNYNEIESVTPIYNNVTTLDNAWDYGTQKVEESSLYNWAKETGTYTVLHTTTNGLGITNTLIPMLMAYWLLISIIYFIFDIALILIWAVHDKIHELKDAI